MNIEKLKEKLKANKKAVIIGGVILLVVIIVAIILAISSCSDTKEGKKDDDKKVEQQKEEGDPSEEFGDLGGEIGDGPLQVDEVPEDSDYEEENAIEAPEDFTEEDTEYEPGVNVDGEIVPVEPSDEVEDQGVTEPGTWSGIF